MSPLLPETQPNWVRFPNHGFSSVVGELGFGEGGFGIGGFDSPSIVIPGTPTPNWVIETLQ